MSTRTLGLSLLGLGLLLFLLGLTADFVGLGEGTRPGYKQLTAMAAGVVVATAGALVTRRKS